MSVYWHHDGDWKRLGATCVHWFSIPLIFNGTPNALRFSDEQAKRSELLLLLQGGGSATSVRELLFASCLRAWLFVCVWMWFSGWQFDEIVPGDRGPTLLNASPLLVHRAKATCICTCIVHRFFNAAHSSRHHLDRWTRVNYVKLHSLMRYPLKSCAQYSSN